MSINSGSNTHRGKASLDKEELKEIVKKEIDSSRQELINLSLRIHASPELGFREEKAASWLADFLSRNGFNVARGICGLATSFRANYGNGQPAIAILAEYDALPKVGHACGHNIIAASAMGAAIGSKLAVDHLGGTISVMGTPAEELYGGKAIMVKQGAFAEFDVAMMVHPGVRTSALSEALACESLEVEFLGKAAHAAAHPEQGINALEAMILSFNAINSLRQHIKSKARVHGIITAGGEAANIVPAYSAGTFLVRAEDDAYLDELKEKVLDCFRGAALATGAELKYKWSEIRYAPLLTNRTLAQLFVNNLESLGRKVDPFETRFGFGSTDMGNVSQVVPGIHPSIAIAPKEVTEHSVEFVQAAASEAGHQGLLDAAKAMAMTIVDLLAEPKMLAEVKEEFLRSREDPCNSPPLAGGE